MANIKPRRINDDTMYEYFERLLYSKNNRRLPAGWKADTDAREYGLTESHAAMLLGSRSLLYGTEDAEKQACLLESLEKFLHEYVGIEGLEELFINNYGVIENNIFLEHDSRGQSKNIREHGKHQMKNAYLGSVLFLDLGYCRDVAKNICQAQSFVTRYMKGEAEKILKKQAGRAGQLSEEAVRKKLEEISYKVFMVSALLHDIGYPLAYYLRSAKQMTEYPPYLKILCPLVKADFSELKAYLLDSKLFQMIDSGEIERKYQENDHGVLSALSLLMHFYHNGRIYVLDDVQRCILEMSAIAIYRHTERFAKGERMVYLTDPVSYMVRLCDDLQEWDRFRLSINEKHNYLQCGNCGRRIPENQGIYECPCGQSYKKITQIHNQKVNYVCLCDELAIRKEENKTKVFIKFHPMKQLEILMEDYGAAVKSKEDLQRVESLLRDQSLDPGIELDFFISNNPILLIEEMIRESRKSEKQILKWMNQDLQGEKQKVFQEFWRDFQAKKKQNPFGGKVESNRLRYGAEVKDYVLKYYGEIYSLYEMLFCSG